MSHRAGTNGTVCGRPMFNRDVIVGLNDYDDDDK